MFLELVFGDDRDVILGNVLGDGIALFLLFLPIGLVVVATGEHGCDGNHDKQDPLHLMLFVFVGAKLQNNLQMPTILGYFNLFS